MVDPKEILATGKKGKCKSKKCAAIIYWFPRPKDGKLLPYDPNGNIHFGSCLDAGSFKKSKDKHPAPAPSEGIPDDIGNRV